LELSVSCHASARKRDSLSCRGGSFQGDKNLLIIFSQCVQILSAQFSKVQFSKVLLHSLSHKLSIKKVFSIFIVCLKS